MDTFSKSTVAVYAVVLVALACKPATDRTTGAVGTPRDTSLAGAPAPLPAETGTAATARAGVGTLSDVNIVALLDEANKADSAAGALVRSKATTADVKAFAQLMRNFCHRCSRASPLQLTPGSSCGAAP